MIHIPFVDRLGWGFMILGSGLVMLIVDIHKRPRRGVDTLMRSFVIMCVAVGFVVILHEILSHAALFDEKEAPSLLIMSQSMV